MGQGPHKNISEWNITTEQLQTSEAAALKAQEVSPKRAHKQLAEAPQQGDGGAQEAHSTRSQDQGKAAFSILPGTAGAEQKHWFV